MLTLKNVLQVALAVYIKILKEHQKEKNQSTHSDNPLHILCIGQWKQLLKTMGCFSFLLETLAALGSHCRNTLPFHVVIHSSDLLHMNQSKRRKSSWVGKWKWMLLLKNSNNEEKLEEKKEKKNTRQSKNKLQTLPRLTCQVMTLLQVQLKQNWLSRKRSIFVVTHFRKWNPYII